MQSKKRSLFESVTNIMVGCGVALGSQYLIFPMFGIVGVTFGEHLGITVWFTVISLARSYILRRCFTRYD